MGWRDTSIGARLGFGFAALIVLMVFLGGVAMWLMNELYGQADLIMKHPFAVTHAVDEVEIHVLKIHREMKDLANVRNEEQIEEHEASVEKFERQALHHLEEARERFLGNPEEIRAVRDALEEWRSIRADVIRLRQAKRFDEADAITRGRGAKHVEKIEAKLRALTDFAAMKAAASDSRAEEILERAFVFTVIFLLVAVGVGAIIAVAITRSIRRPLKDLDSAAGLVARGDFDHEIRVRSGDELGRLSHAFNEMVSSIRQQSEEIHIKNEENERLLLNILPGPIADRLKKGEETIADYFPDVTVLFADIAGFTPISSTVEPRRLVELLNRVFTGFDDAATRLGVEKVKTIGDAYMAVTGLNEPSKDPAGDMVQMAIDMLHSVSEVNDAEGTDFEIRIGINCGAVVAGVVGRSKFIYDLWGDAVNLASRMESHGIDGRIHVSQAVAERVRDRFVLEERGDLEIKGMGRLRTFLVVAGRSAPGGAGKT